MDVRYRMVGEIPSNLIDELYQQIKPEHWYIDSTRNNMANLEKTQSVVMRYFDSYESRLLDNYKDHIVDFQIFEHYKTTIQNFLDELKKYYKFSNYICFLAKLKANSDIGMHIDGDRPWLRDCHRIHIPIKTNSNVFYIIEDEAINWEKGKIYEFDNMRIHGVQNKSNEERIHMMFNLYN